MKVTAQITRSKIAIFFLHCLKSMGEARIATPVSPTCREIMKIRRAVDRVRSETSNWSRSLVNRYHCAVLSVTMGPFDSVATVHLLRILVPLLARLLSAICELISLNSSHHQQILYSSNGLWRTCWQTYGRRTDCWFNDHLQCSPVVSWWDTYYRPSMCLRACCAFLLGIAPEN